MNVNAVRTYSNMTQTEDGWTEGSTLFPLLWNQCDANYFKKNVKQDAWIEIGNAMKKLQK